MTVLTPNLIKLIDIAMDRVDNLNDVYDYLESNLNLNDAEGVWLDLIGEIIGLPRPYREQPYGTIFAFKDDEDDVDDPYKGFLDSGVGGYFQTTVGTGYLADPTETMDDDTYRLRLASKGLANHVSGTIPDIYTFLTSGFEQTDPAIVSTAGAVNITILEADTMSQGDRNRLESIGPIAAGVGVNVDNWTFEYPHFTPNDPSLWSIPAATVTVDSKDAKYILGNNDFATLQTTSYYGITAAAAAYGAWTFWLDKAGNTAPIFMPIASVNDEPLGATQDGYALRIDISEAVELIKITNGVEASLMKTGNGFISPVLYNKYTITRSITGIFTVYVNDVIATALTGSNPVTDTTYAVSNYMSMFSNSTGDLWPIWSEDDETAYMSYTPL